MKKLITSASIIGRKSLFYLGILWSYQYYAIAIDLPATPGVAPSTSALRAPSPAQFLTNRSVEIEWDEVHGATQYDLEVYDGKHKKFIKTFTSKSNIFKLNVKMGKYYFRSRIFDKFGRSSEWTDLAELLIAPPPTKITNKSAENQQFFAEKNSGLLNYPIRWEALPGISEYKVILETTNGQQELEILVRGTSTVLKVPPGQHQVRIRAILSDGTIGELSEPSSVISVLGAKIQKPTVTYKKDSKLDPVVSFSSELSIAQFDGELFYMPLEGTTWKKVKDYRDLKTKQIIFNSDYIPGKYQLRMLAKSKGFTPSEFGITEFVIKPLEVVITPIPQETITLTNIK